MFWFCCFWHLAKIFVNVIEPNNGAGFENIDESRKFGRFSTDELDDTFSCVSNSVIVAWLSICKSRDELYYTYSENRKIMLPSLHFINK